MSGPDDSANFTVIARGPHGVRGDAEIAEGELERARHALAYLKGKLGNDAMRSLLSSDLAETTARVEAWLAESGGTWQTESIELAVTGPSATEFQDWYEAMVKQGQEAVMRAGHPEHFVSHPQPEFVEVVENVGETDLPWHVFYHPLPDDDPTFPTQWDPDFPVRFGAEILNSNGTRVGFTMHQSRNAEDGLHLKLTTYLPKAVPITVVHRHLRHFAIEFTNWTRAAYEELATAQSQPPSSTTTPE